MIPAENPLVRSFDQGSCNFEVCCYDSYMKRVGPEWHILNGHDPGLRNLVLDRALFLLLATWDFYSTSQSDLGDQTKRQLM